MIHLAFEEIISKLKRMPIDWTNSVEDIIFNPFGHMAMLNLTTEQMNRLITAASLHKEIIESTGKDWASVDIIKDGSFFTINVRRGRIHSDGSKEKEISTYRYYLDYLDRIRYSEIVHL